MAQLSDDCFAFGGPLMTVAEAWATLESRLAAVTGIERVTLDDAPGRILASDLVAGRAVPPHPNSAVDGYAVQFADLAPEGETALPVGGRIAAGHPLERPVRPGEALKVLTGAAMPPGPDTVFMEEDCRVEDGCVLLPQGLKRGANYRRAGEDIAEGSTVLTAGRRLRAGDLGMAAALGVSTLPVRQRLRVALLSTGDELREAGRPVPQGAVYDANRPVLAVLLRELGCSVTDLGILPDRRAAIAAALRIAATHDAIVTSGGVSGGDEDHVKAALEGAGGRVDLWRLAIKPGRPVALGRLGRAAFIGLPGNPAAAVVTFMVLARPILLALSGAVEKPPVAYPVSADFTHRKKAGRREFLRVHLQPAENGPLAAKFAREGAGILSSIVETDGLIDLSEATVAVAPGDIVPFLPWSSLG